MPPTTKFKRQAIIPPIFFLDAVADYVYSQIKQAARPGYAIEAVRANWDDIVIDWYQDDSETTEMKPDVKTTVIPYRLCSDGVIIEFSERIWELVDQGCADIGELRFW